VDRALVEHAEDEVDDESAAAMRIGVLDRDDWKAWALPESSSAAKALVQLLFNLLDAGTASPIEEPGTRLYEIVTGRELALMLTTSGDTLTTLSTRVDNGTCCPLDDLT